MFLHERIFRTLIAAVYEGRINDAVIKCDENQKIALENVAKTTKKLRNLLENDDADISVVTNTLVEHKKAKDIFYSQFHIDWPL